MSNGLAPEDPDGPLYVPQAFEDAYREEARRTVARRRRGRRRPGAVSWSSMPLAERLRVGLWMAHGFGALLLLLFAGLTRTWLVGLVLLVVLAVSLGASLGAAENVRSRRGGEQRPGSGWGGLRRPPGSG